MRCSLDGISKFELAVRDEVKVWMARRGVRQSNVSYRLRGKAALVIHDSAVIVRYLGITMADLLGTVGTGPIVFPQHAKNPAPAETGTGSRHTVRPVGLEPTTHGLNDSLHPHLCTAQLPKTSRHHLCRNSFVAASI